MHKMEQNKLYLDHVSINKSHMQIESIVMNQYGSTKSDKEREKSSMPLLQKY